MTTPKYRKIFSYLEKLFFVFIIAYLVIQKGPEWVRSFHWEGKSVTMSTPVFSVKDSGRINLVSSQKRVLVFWATWCGPCTIELDRINEFAKEYPQWSNQILAISIGEKLDVVKKAALERGYEFSVATDENAVVTDQLEIQSTPTILFVDAENKVQWRSSGLSPSLSFRLKRFFSAPDPKL